MGKDSTSTIAQSLGGLSALAQHHGKVISEFKLPIEDVYKALDEFSECVRYLNTRRSKGAVLSLESEADVQDVLYILLRPWIRDLTPESPSDKNGNRYGIRDFVSRSLRMVLEVKFVRDKDHGKSISKELHDDIETYRHHVNCDTLIFFVYDPNSLIPDQRDLRRVIEQSRVYDGKSLTCKMIVNPI